MCPEFLLSPRDKKPVVVRCGLPLKPSGQQEPVVLAHEADGINGKRFVVFAPGGRIEEIDDAKFVDLLK